MTRSNGAGAGGFPAVRIEGEPLTGGKLRLRVEDPEGSLLHVDVLDLSKASARGKFVQAIVAKVPSLEADQVERILLDLASKPIKDNPVDDPDVVGEELDLGRVVRPEMLYIPAVSALSIPSIYEVDQEPKSRWLHFLRWKDGRRECRILSSSIVLPDGSRLLINPIPSPPAITQASTWSAAARKAWLDGSPAPNPALVFGAIMERIANLLEFPPESDGFGISATMALWSMLTYSYRCWHAFPYLFFGGPVGSAKSRCLEILDPICYRPFLTASVTAPSLFRTLHDKGGTLLLDEPEWLRSPTPEQRELLAMLLVGYKKGGMATRLEEVDKQFIPRHFDVYCPKAFSCIDGLPPALSSRCIHISMLRAGKGSEKAKRKVNDDPEKWQTIRDDLHAMVLEFGHEIQTLPSRMDVLGDKIFNRNAELWQPILAMAAWLEPKGLQGLVERLQRYALFAIEDAKDDQVQEMDEILLQTLYKYRANGSHPTSEEILNAAKGVDSVAFNKSTGNSISRRLKKYAIKNKSYNGRKEFRVEVNALREIAMRYGIILES